MSPVFKKKRGVSKLGAAHVRGGIMVFVSKSHHLVVWFRITMRPK
jgi:hypothetical protein